MGESVELPGPLPVNLSRSRLSSLETNEYGVCEKSDGERYMLLLLSTMTPAGVPPGAYLINRAFQVSIVSGGEVYAGVMAEGGPTLLDGELLRRDSDLGSGTGALVVYMPFDCISACGRDAAALPLARRLQELQVAVRTPFQTLEESRRVAGLSGLPLYILAKQIVPKSEVGSLLKKITLVGGGAHADGICAPLESATATGGIASVHRLYRDGKRVNPSDGLIFTPGAPSYRELFGPSGSGAENPLPVIKWKYPDECTVDFSIRASDLERVRDAGKGGGRASEEVSSKAFRVPLSLKAFKDREVETCYCLMSPTQASGYLEMVAALESRGSERDGLIVECAFDAPSSSWAIRRVRDSKTIPNAIKTGWGTLESLVENISEDELSRKFKK